jgi:hypothetical protein
MLYDATIGLPNHKVDGGLRSFSVGPLLHVRLDIFYPWVSGFSWLVLGIIVGAVVGFCSISSTGELSFALMATVWVAIIVTALGVFVHRFRMQESGAADLIIDASRGVLEMPRYPKPTERITLSIADVQDVKVNTSERGRSRGGVAYSYQVMLHLRTGSPVQVLEWSNPDRASAFSWWLKGKIEEATRNHSESGRRQ